MSNVQRGVVRTPNERLQGLARTRSMTPSAGRPMIPAPNRSPRSGAVGGSGPLTRSASPVSIPDHRFHVDNAKMPQPPSAIEPGKGAVPVYPFSPTGKNNTVRRETELAGMIRMAQTSNGKGH